MVMTTTMTTMPSPIDPRPPSSRASGAGLLKLLETTERPLRLLQAHDGLSARIASEAGVGGDLEGKRFHGLWISSLADSASRAQPDEETIDLGDRISALSWMLDATDLPVVFDADTGGQPQQASLTVRRLARLGVAAVVFEDQGGGKRNSLGPGHLAGSGAPIGVFCDKLRAAVAASPPGGPLVVARIESLIRGEPVDDVVQRGLAYLGAGAHALLIHGPGPSAEPVLQAVRQCRAAGIVAPIFVVPTAYGSVHERELASAGVDIVIYANHLIRAAVVAMRRVATTLLEAGHADAADAQCVAVAELLTVIAAPRGS